MKTRGHSYLPARRVRQQRRIADADSGPKKTAATLWKAVREPPFSFLREAGTGRRLCLSVTWWPVAGGQQLYCGTKQRVCELQRDPGDKFLHQNVFLWC